MELCQEKKGRKNMVNDMVLFWASKLQYKIQLFYHFLQAQDWENFFTVIGWEHDN